MFSNIWYSGFNKAKEVFIDKHYEEKDEFDRFLTRYVRIEYEEARGIGRGGLLAECPWCFTENILLLPDDSGHFAWNERAPFCCFNCDMGGLYLVAMEMDKQYYDFGLTPSEYGHELFLDYIYDRS